MMTKELKHKFLLTNHPFKPTVSNGINVKLIRAHKPAVRNVYASPSREEDIDVGEPCH